MRIRCGVEILTVPCRFIDKFEKARLSTLSITNKCRLSIQEKQRLVSGFDINETKSKIKNLENEIHTSTKEQEQNKKTLEITRTEKQSLFSELANLKQKQLLLQSIEQKISTNLALLNESKSSIENF